MKFLDSFISTRNESSPRAPLSLNSILQSVHSIEKLRVSIQRSNVRVFNSFTSPCNLDELRKQPLKSLYVTFKPFGQAIKTAACSNTEGLISEVVEIE